jgi:hypothetical protein
VRQAREDFRGVEERRGPRVEVLPGDLRVYRVGGADRVGGHPDLVAALVGVEHGRPYASVQVHAGHDQRGGAPLSKGLSETGAPEGAEEALREERFASVRFHFGRRGATRRPFDAGPGTGSLPMRHPVASVGTYHRVRVQHGQPPLAETVRQARCIPEDRFRRRHRDVALEKIALQVDEQENGPHVR